MPMMQKDNITVVNKRKELINILLKINLRKVV